MPIAAIPVPPAGSEPPRSWSWRHAAMAIGIVACLASVTVLVRSLPRFSASASSEAETAEGWASTLALPEQPPPPDPAGSRVHQTLDSVRAGNAAYALGNLDAALEQYRAAVAASPTHAEARNNLAQVLIRRGEVAAALPHLDVAVQLDSERWTYRFNRGRAYSLLERWPEAVAEYEAADRLFPDDYATQYNLGLALLSLRRFPDAVHALERAVAMAPAEQNFLITLGTAYLGSEDPTRAREVFQQFLDRAPQDSEAPRVKALLDALPVAGR